MFNEILKSLMTSASKIVLLVITGAMTAALFTGHVSEDTFKSVALMVMTFYFTRKGDSPEQPYEGK